MGDLPPRIIIRTCRHILDCGAFCGGAAVTGRAYCRHHVASRIRLRNMARMRRQTHVLRLAPLLDAEGIDLAQTQLLVSLAAGRTDSATGRLLLWAIKMARATLVPIEPQTAAQTASDKVGHAK